MAVVTLKSSDKAIFQQLQNQIALDIIEDLKEAYLDTPKSSGTDHSQFTVNKFLYEADKSAITSTNWALAIKNSGFPRGIFPNIEAIKTWLLEEDGTLSDRQIDQKAYLIGKSIEKNGINPTFFIDRVLWTFNNT